MATSLAVVTGATGTLGARLVATLAERGLSVLAVSRSGSAPGAGEVACVAADLGDDSSIDAIAQALPEGELAMAVHAIGLPGSPDVMRVEPDLLGVAANLKAGGFLRLIRAVDDRIGEGSRLVAVAGHLGAEPTEHTPVPGVGNAALANLVRQLAHPIGRRGASVHLLVPGPFDSPRVDALLERRAQNSGHSAEEARAELLAEYPLGRMPSADDVCWAATSLLHPSASAMNGSATFLDGGVRKGIF